MRDGKQKPQNARLIPTHVHPEISALRAELVCMRADVNSAYLAAADSQIGVIICSISIMLLAFAVIISANRLRREFMGQ